MSVAHLYQQFDDFECAQPPVADASSEAIEDQKLESFEAGYRAGWDDAIKAQADDRARISEEFAQNLQEMSFGYHEALARLTAAMQPLMTQIVEKLLPETAHATLGAHVLEQLRQMTREHAEQPIEIVVADSNVAVIETLVEGRMPDAFTVSPDSTLGEGQAFVRVGAVERQIDLDAVIAGIREAMAAAFQEEARRA